MDTQNPVPEPDARLTARYDTDPDALAWARAKIQHYIERIARFEEQATESSSDKARGLRVARRSAEQTLIGGEGCVVGAFDVRRPQMFAGAAPTPTGATAVGSDPAARLTAAAAHLRAPGAAIGPQALLPLAQLLETEARVDTEDRAALAAEGLGPEVEHRSCTVATCTTEAALALADAILGGDQ